MVLQARKAHIELFARRLRQGDERVPLSTIVDDQARGAEPGSMCPSWTTDSHLDPLSIFSSATSSLTTVNGCAPYRSTRLNGPLATSLAVHLVNGSPMAVQLSGVIDVNGRELVIDDLERVVKQVL